MVKNWYTVTFGTYMQELPGEEKQPIEWNVLEVCENRALLLSRYALDVQVYDSTGKPATWKSCTLRRWLNTAVLHTAFTPLRSRTFRNTPELRTV